MKTKRYFRVAIRGELLGHIWQNNYEAQKEVSEIKRYEESLHDFVERICNDGDFQDCKLSKNSIIEISMDVFRNSGMTLKLHHIRSEWWDVNMFPSIQEFVSDQYGMEEE